MKKKIVVLCFTLATFNLAYSQGAKLKVKLLDSSFASVSDYVFQVQIENDTFPTYLVQDTAYLRRQISYFGTDMLYVVLEKKEGSDYIAYEKQKRPTGDLTPPDSCRLYCCPCIVLAKGETIKLNVPLLERFKLEKGEYRMAVVLGPPLGADVPAEERGEIYTDYYFRVP